MSFNVISKDAMLFSYFIDAYFKPMNKYFNIYFIKK